VDVGGGVAVDWGTVVVGDVVGVVVGGLEKINWNAMGNGTGI
jgi:hypothetical protein